MQLNGTTKEYWHVREAKKNKKRLRKLIQKAQKAQVLESVSEILSVRTWNKRFRTVAKLRVIK
jgi:hypothetical protein